MSFVRIMATLAVGFATVKGMQKMRAHGGVAGMTEAMRKAGQPGGMADDIGAMAQRMGIPVETEQLRGMFDRFGATAADATTATQSGFANMMGAMTSKAGPGAAGCGGLKSAMTEGTPLDKASEQNAKLMIRAMIQAARADGVIDAQERQAILDHLGDAAPEEIAFVDAEMAAPVDVMALARDTGTQMRDQVYSAALMAVQVDSDAERQYLRQLAQALGLEEEDRDALHRAMGKPAL